MCLPHSPLNSDHSNVNAIALAPIFPFNPVTSSPIHIQELHHEQNPSRSGSVPIAEPHHETDNCAAPKPTATMVFTPDFPVTHLELRQKGLGNKLGEEKEHSLLALPWRRGFGDVSSVFSPASSIASLKRHRKQPPWRRRKRRPPVMQRWLPPRVPSPPCWVLVPGSNGPQFILWGSMGVGASLKGNCLLGLFIFDPGGDIPNVRRAPPSSPSKDSVQPSPFHFDPVISFSVRCAAINRIPDRSSPPPATVYSPATAPSQGATSCRPWVPWRFKSHTARRVFLCMSEMLKGYFLLGLITVGWAMFLFKRKWAAREVLFCFMTFGPQFLTVLGVSAIPEAMGLGLPNAIGATAINHDTIVVKT